jgi:hypothetical protein
MKNLLGVELNQSTVAVLYLCKLKKDKLEVFRCIEFDDSFNALQAYSNIPNPESQMASGKDKKSFERELEILHERMLNPEWVKELHKYI